MTTSPVVGQPRVIQLSCIDWLGRSSDDLSCGRSATCYTVQLYRLVREVK